MPLPMVHITVAIRARPAVRAALSSSGGASAGWRSEVGSYLLGAIAPDAIHMRPGWSREDKKRIHLFGEDKALSIRYRQIEELRSRARAERSALQKSPTAAAWRTGFLDGYLTHLAADALWSHLLVRTYHERVLAGLSADEKRTTYYRETDKADFSLYHSAPWRDAAWAALWAAEPVSFLGYLSGTEIGMWRDRTLAFFADPAKEPSEEPGFFTPDRIERFVEVAATACSAAIDGSFVEAGRALEDRYEVGALT